MSKKESVRRPIEALPRHKRCRRHSISMDCTKHYCYRGDDIPDFVLRSESTPIDVSECEGCELFVNRYLEFPLDVDDIEIEETEYRKLFGYKPGTLVRVRPCGEEYKGKTYVGLFVADAPTDVWISYDRKRKVLKISPSEHNPMILIPELRTIVWGYESWWDKINSPEELREITNDEIMNTWYMKLLDAMTDKSE